MGSRNYEGRGFERIQYILDAISSGRDPLLEDIPVKVPETVTVFRSRESKMIWRGKESVSIITNMLDSLPWIKSYRVSERFGREDRQGWDVIFKLKSNLAVLGLEEIGIEVKSSYEMIDRFRDNTLEFLESRGRVSASARKNEKEAAIDKHYLESKTIVLNARDRRVSQHFYDQLGTMLVYWINKLKQN